MKLINVIGNRSHINWVLPPGTAEVKHTINGTKTVTLENVQFSSQHLSLGLESTLSWGDQGAEGRVEVRFTFKTDHQK